MRHVQAHDPLAPLKAAAKLAQKQGVANDPLAWAKLTLPDVKFWSKQLEIITAVDQHSRVAVRACHDSSKSFTAAVIAARWLDTHPAGSARVITTAPTGTQVRAILWVEINQLHEQADLPGRVNQTEWWLGSYLAGIGRKPADYNPAAFQGLHARFPLIIIDEAAGVPTAIIEAAETLATNINAKILMIGNPDDPSSLFADIHANPAKHGYHTIKIAAWDTPNFSGEVVDPLLNEVLLSKEWVETRRTAWGIDHPFWLSKVEAEFPPIDTNSVIKLHDLIAARVPYAERQVSAGVTTNPASASAPFATPVVTDLPFAAVAPSTVTSSADAKPPLGYQGGTPGVVSSATMPFQPGMGRWTVLGVDVAGSESGDETIARLILPANVPTNEARFRSNDPEKVAHFIYTQILTTNPDKLIIDSIGVGFGIIGLVRKLIADAAARVWSTATGHAPVVEGFNGAARSNQPDIYGNQRAELWWETRLLFQQGKVDTSGTDNLETLEAQLIAPRYKIEHGKIWVESKKDIKQRIGRSPDNADAFLYALWDAINSGVVSVATPPPNQVVATRHSFLGMRNNPLAHAARLRNRRG
jgi:hypothetical protein